MTNIIPCGQEHIEELISFVTRMNHHAEHHIGYFGVGETDVRSSLAETVIPPAEGFRLAYENGNLIGVFGVDADPEINRAWLLGPIIEHAEWQRIADDLFAAVLPLIPAGIGEQELFCDVNNLNLKEFAKRHGFPPRSETAIFSMERNAYIEHPISAHIIDFHETHFAQFEGLHNELFPNTYYTARQIVEKLDDHHRLFIALDGGHLLGYHFCKLEPDSGYVDFIGTSASARGRGVGSSLLASGLNWMLGAPSTKRITLTVNADNASARRLYEKFGFTLERVTCGFRRTVHV
ncbi:MAG: GNAT family N-acetyltransferase [Anaerolineales bacterium]|nr:GNAT family N-acetyltransferase [Anaerolineales bacterium]